MARQAKASGLVLTASVDNQASSELKRIADSSDDLGAKIVKLNQSTQLLERGWAAVSGATSAVIGLFAACTTEAMEAARAERDLGAALRLYSGDSEKALEASKAYADQMQRATGVSGDSILQMQAQLATLGVLPKNLNAATTAALGWSRATGKDMTAAGKDVLAVLEGRLPGSLKKLAPEVKTAEQAIAFMSRGVRLLQEDASSLEGQLRIFGEATGDMREALGSAALQSDTLTSGVSILTDTVNDLRKTFESPEFVGAIDAVFRTIAGGAGSTLEAMLGLSTFWDRELKPKMAWWKMTLSGKSFIAEPLNTDAEDAKKKVLENMQQLADRLRELGARGAFKVEVKTEIPKTPPIDPQKAIADKAAAAKAQKEREEAIRLESEMKLGQWAKDAEQQRKIEEKPIRARIAIERLAAEEQRAIKEGLWQAAERAKAAERESVEENDALIEQQRARAANAAGYFASFGSTLIVDGFRSGFEDIGEMFTSLMADLAARLISSMLFNVLLSAFAPGSGAAAAGAGGGLLGLLGFAGGGPVPAFAGGGWVDGPPGRDVIPAMLTRGEYVLDVDTVQTLKRDRGLNLDLVQAIRSDRPPPRRRGVQRFAEGGPVGAIRARESRASARGRSPTINLVQNYLVPPTTLEHRRNVRDGLLGAFKDLKRMGWL